MALCLALPLAVWAGLAGAAPQAGLDERAWITDGEVHAVAVAADGSTFIGGDFKRVSPFTGGFAVLDTTGGEAGTGWPAVAGEVLACAPDGAGGHYIGGTFTAVGGVPRGHLAHIHADGSLDATWGPGADDEVKALAVSRDGETVYVGGKFEIIGGEPRKYVAALDGATGAVVDTWAPAVNGWVFALAVSGDGATVYAGGHFIAVNGVGYSRAAALDAETGATDPSWRPEASSIVQTLAVSADGGTVYAGGAFTEIGGEPRKHVAALDPATGQATAFNARSNGSVDTIAVSDDAIYVGGGFTQMDGQDRYFIAKLDPATGAADPSWSPDADNPVKAVAVSRDGETVYVGGKFEIIGGERRRNIAALDAGGQTTAWAPEADDTVWTLSVAADGQAVCAGGEFTGVGGLSRRNFAALGRDGRPTACDPGPDGRVYALAVAGDTVCAGGGFYLIGGEPRPYIVKLDVQTGAADPSWSPHANGAVRALAVSDDGDTVYAGGQFSKIGGEDRRYIAALSAESGAATVWDPDANGPVGALTVDGDTVYAGGQFTVIGGEGRRNIAALSAESGVATAWDPSANSSVGALAVSGDGRTVYAGGRFSLIGGVRRDFIAALDAETGVATGWDPGADHYVNALTLAGDTVYAGGQFTEVGGELRDGIAALDAGGHATPWDPGANSSVRALAVFGDALHVGGSFTAVGGEARRGFARFPSSDTTPPTTTVSKLPAGWRNKPVTLTFTVRDEEDGSGMSAPGFARTEFKLGANAWTALEGATLTIDESGDHKLQYRSVDVAGNVEKAGKVNVRIDRIKPKPKAPEQARVQRGGKATLRYRVTDAKPCGANATVVIRIKARNGKGKLVKVVKLGKRKVNSAKLLSVKFKVPATQKWRRGTYRFYVYATDAAGNKQAKVASNKLLVR